MVGRASGQLQLEVLTSVDRESLESFGRRALGPGATVYTDDWAAYGDNTTEGVWTGLRNFLRPFRGVSKWYLDLYVGMFQWAYTLKAVTSDVIRALCGLWPVTNLGS